MGKTVVVIDLNPLSRSAQQASITIVDELSRTLKFMLELSELEGKVAVDPSYDHHAVLEAGLGEMLSSLSRTTDA